MRGRKKIRWLLWEILSTRGNFASHHALSREILSVDHAEGNAVVVGDDEIVDAAFLEQPQHLADETIAVDVLGICRHVAADGFDADLGAAGLEGAGEIALGEDACKSPIFRDNDDGAGASLGPLAIVCKGFDAGISAVFVNTADPMVSLKWNDSSIVLPRVGSASGAKYESDAWGGVSSFWTQGKEALFTPPGGTELTCVVEEIG